MERKIRMMKSGLAVFFACLLFVFVQNFLEFEFYYREHHNLFLYGSNAFLGSLGVIGGFSDTLACWCLQFFRIPYAGAAITSAIAVLGSIFMASSIPHQRSRLWLMPLCFLPFAAECILLSSYYYGFSGIISLLLFSAFMAAYSLAADQTNLKAAGRMILAAFLVLVLYLISGPVAMLLSVAVLLNDLAAKRKGWQLQFITIAAAIACGTIFYAKGWTETILTAFTPAAYYETRLSLPWSIFIPWAAMLFLQVMMFAGGKSRKLTVDALLAGVSAACVIFFTATASKALDGREEQRKISHFVTERDWDAVIEAISPNSKNYLMMTYRNLALAEKGQLLERLMDFQQHGGLSLLAVTDPSDNLIPDVSEIESNVYYAMGNIAAAQNYAFDTYVGYDGRCPAALMRLVETNLIYGAYDVAEKYISVLEKTRYYSDWAAGRRRFLHNDEAVDEDPVLGPGRRNLPEVDGFVKVGYPFNDLLEIVAADPSNRTATEYLLSGMLLEKDFASLKAFIDNHPLKAGESLPVILQEAVVVFSEGDRDYCRSAGVTEETFSRYEKFKSKFLECRRSKSNPVPALRPAFGKTYWFYVMFEQL